MIKRSDKHTHGKGCMVEISCTSCKPHYMVYQRMVDLVTQPIRDLHKQINGPADDFTCSECCVDEYNYPVWPCATIQALNEANNVENI